MKKIITKIISLNFIYQEKKRQNYILKNLSLVNFFMLKKILKFLKILALENLVLTSFVYPF